MAIKKTTKTYRQRCIFFLLPMAPTWFGMALRPNLSHCDIWENGTVSKALRKCEACLGQSRTSRGAGAQRQQHRPERWSEASTHRCVPEPKTRSRSTFSTNSNLFCKSMDELRGNQKSTFSNLLKFYDNISANLDFQKINTLTELQQQLNAKRYDKAAFWFFKSALTQFSATEGLPPGPRPRSRLHHGGQALCLPCGPLPPPAFGTQSRKPSQIQERERLHSGKVKSSEKAKYKHANTIWTDFYILCHNKI